MPIVILRKKTRGSLQPKERHKQKQKRTTTKTRKQSTAYNMTLSPGPRPARSRGRTLDLPTTNTTRAISGWPYTIFISHSQGFVFSGNNQSHHNPNTGARETPTLPTHTIMPHNATTRNQQQHPTSILRTNRSTVMVSLTQRRILIWLTIQLEHKKLSLQVVRKYPVITRLG